MPGTSLIFGSCLVEGNEHLSRAFTGRIRLGSIRDKNNWNNASKRLFGSYSHSGIPGFPFRLFCTEYITEYILVLEDPKRTRPKYHCFSLLFTEVAPGEWTDDTSKLCLYLYLALLPQNHKLFHE